jgi:hypothetical protein
MQSITLRSHVGADGQLQLNIPTDLMEMDLEVTVFLKSISSTKINQQQTFSERWRGKFKGLGEIQKLAAQDIRLQYLVEHYDL